MKRIIAVATLLLGTAVLLPAATDPGPTTALVVHEWGTFTSFQGPDGDTISGINVDDEPVPSFVHRLSGVEIFTAGSYPAAWSQGAPLCHADVTLRLETPVLYFYPGSAFRTDQPVEVEATFPGGWLTEFFPFAAAEVPGFPDTLNASTRGRLKWSDLRLAHEGAPSLPQTSERVWLAPRKVQSAVITTGNEREAEKYLFYRGVGHLDAPLVVQQQGGELTVALRDGETLLAQFPPSWVVRVLPDGRVWHRALRPDEARNGRITLSLPRGEAGATHGSLDALRRELESALVLQGLFPDEARAMLETWQLSYFASEGLRVFFLLPQTWTDTRLPLSISTPADITRVMMGRIELISVHQRATLEQLYDLPAEAFDLPPVFAELLNETEGLSEEDQLQRQRKVMQLLEDRGHSHADFYETFGLEVPSALRLYDSLGRFRDALLGHEWHSAQDAARRKRLTQIIGTFSACLPPGVH